MASMKNKILNEADGVAVSSAGKRTWYCRLIAVGTSLNGRVFSKEMLETYGPAAFPKNTRSHADHQSWREEDEHPVNSVKTLVGHIDSDPVMDTVDGVEGLYANIKFSEAFAPFIEEFHDVIGLSIHAYYLVDELDERNDGLEVVSMLIPSPTNTVDVVTVPAAGGKVLEAMESYCGTIDTDEQKRTDDGGMKPEEITALAEAIVSAIAPKIEEAVKPAEPEKVVEDGPKASEIAEALIEAKLPKVARENVYARIAGGTPLTEAVTAEGEYIKSLTEALKNDELEGVTHNSKAADESFDFKLNRI